MLTVALEQNIQVVSVNPLLEDLYGEWSRPDTWETGTGAVLRPGVGVECCDVHFRGWKMGFVEAYRGP